MSLAQRRVDYPILPAHIASRSTESVEKWSARRSLALIVALSAAVWMLLIAGFAQVVRTLV